MKRHCCKRLDSPIDQLELKWVRVIDITQGLINLAKQRPIFHSEADFQHALAWQIQSQLPDASIRLELPILDQQRTLHLDVWVSHGDTNLAVELKYKTRAIETRIQGESYCLKDQSAQDLGRYDFIKDIVRLERITSARPNTTGYAILLTNDSAYWSSDTGINSIYAAFRLGDGLGLEGTRAWGENASIGTTRGRETALALKGKYTIRWQDYSQVPAKRYAKFRFLCIPIFGVHENLAP